MSEWKNRPIVIFICPHFWRREWWGHRHCGKCTRWETALFGGAGI